MRKTFGTGSTWEEKVGYSRAVQVDNTVPNQYESVPYLLPGRSWEPHTFRFLAGRDGS